MPFLRTFFLALLLVAWIPATNACALAAAFPEAFQSCPEAEGAMQESSAPCDSACQECVSFEGGFPPSLAQVSAMPAPQFEDLWLTRLLALLALRPVDESVPPAESPPREIPLWHLVARTALPVRGPAFA
jgi:hypothetical protein